MSQVPDRVQPGQDHLGVRLEQVADRGVELLAAPLAGELRAASDAADAVRHLDVLGELREPRGHRDVLPASSPGQPRPSQRS